MAIHVSFSQPAYVGDRANLAVGKPRVSEVVAVGSATLNSSADGEYALIVNTEADPIMLAVGSAPDAGATTATDATSASFVVPSGGFIIVETATGDKIDTAAEA